MPAASTRIATGMPFGERLLWYLAWNRKPVYICAAALGIIAAFKVQSPYGLLLALLPLFVLFKAVQLVNAHSPQLIEAGKQMALKAGSERTGVSPASTTAFALLSPSGSAPLGIRTSPSYRCSCVFLSDDYVATFSVTSLSVLDRMMKGTPSAEEMYFRHITAINQNGDGIEIVLNRGSKPRRIETGNDPAAGKLIDVLRTRLRAPKAPPQISEPVSPVQPVAFEERTPFPASPVLVGSDSERFCYIRSSKLMEYYSDPSVIDALMDRLGVPGTAATHKMMGVVQKRTAIEAQIDHFSQSPTSFWYGVSHNEILAASIWRCRGEGFLTDKVVYAKFYDVAREEDLCRPVAKWLNSRNEDPYMEIQLGRRRIDVLGYTKRTQRLTAVELKNSDEEFRRGPDQMGSFTEYAHAVYLACTPAFAADYLERNAGHRSVNRWDPTLLDRKLKQGGFGLLIVERDNVYEVIKPVEQSPSVERVQKTIASLTNFQRVELD
jgi:hypothetical protein